jgi:uncharacterized protein with NRDE domain
LLVNQHHVVIAVVIAYHLRVLRKRSKMVSSYFVNTVKSYCSRNNTVAYARKFGTTQMVETGFVAMSATFGFMLNVTWHATTWRI